jgi:small subunit ribosomal protein S6
MPTMAFYENVVIARQDLAQAQVDALADQMTETLKGLGGEVKKREYWGLRSLTYRMKKNRKGHYMYLGLECSGAALAEIERQLRINEDVLRFLSVRVEAIEEGPTAMMQKREDRGDRDDRGFGGGFGGPRGDRGDRGDRPRRRDFDGGDAPAAPMMGVN